MAVADASFKIVNEAISFGFSRANEFATPAMPELESGIPSITINGSLLAFSDEPPRIRIVLPEPGAPPFGVMDTPATLPLINCSGVVTTPLLKSLAVTVDTDPVRSFFLDVP